MDPESRSMGINWQFYHWHLEPSAICPLTCPRCPRSEHPDTPWLNYQMDLAFFQSFMTPDRLAKDVRRITMCGDVGDPIYCRDYLRIYRYIKQHNPKCHVFTITNGTGKTEKWWQEFGSIANEYDSINFSVDGFDNASNNIYRINSNFDSILRGIRALRVANANIFMNWALIVFRFNQNHINDIVVQARDLGMDAVQITKSTKFGSKYGAAYQGGQDPLEPDAKWISSTHRYERNMIDISGRLQPRQAYLEQNHRQFKDISARYSNAPIIPMCEIGNRGLYVNAEGVVFPCSWVSFPYHSLTYNGKTIKWEDSFFAKYRARMNLRLRSLETILADPLWDFCSRGWRDSKHTWAECGEKCHRDLVDESYAVGWETN